MYRNPALHTGLCMCVQESCCTHRALYGNNSPNSHLLVGPIDIINQLNSQVHSSLYSLDWANTPILVAMATLKKHLLRAQHMASESLGNASKTSALSEELVEVIFYLELLELVIDYSKTLHFIYIT